MSAGFPHDALERVRDVHIPRLVEGEIVQSDTQIRVRKGRQRHEDGRRPGGRVHVENITAAEVNDEESAVGMEAEPKQVGAGSRDRNLPQQPASSIEDEELTSPEATPAEVNPKVVT